MPLLMCPNDNTAMTTVERTGVQFDMCPTCRGVWLDRGEMEKLMDAARTESASSAPPPPPPGGAAYRPHTYDSGSVGGYARSGGEWGERGEGGEYGERGERGHGGHRRRSIFDIFD